MLTACVNLSRRSDNGPCVSYRAQSICRVLLDARDNDGIDVIVDGIYRVSPEGSLLMASACQGKYVNLKDASDYMASKNAVEILRSLTRRNQFRPISVVIRGTFRVAQPGQCFGAGCERYEIEIHELLCAEAVEHVNGRAN